MADKSNWMPKVASTQLELPFPKRPGIKTVRRLADVCPKCKCLHLDAEAAQSCRSMTAQREQL